MSARMLGRVSPPWCPVCHAPPGPDCPDRARDPRQVRAWEKRDWRRRAYLSVRQQLKNRTDSGDNTMVNMTDDCKCDLIDVSTHDEVQYVRGRSNGCTVHPPTEMEQQQTQLDAQRKAERDALTAAAMKAAREA